MVISGQFLSCVKKNFRVYLVTERDHQRYNLQLWMLLVKTAEILREEFLYGNLSEPGE